MTASDCAAKASFEFDEADLLLLQTASFRAADRLDGPMPMISGGTPFTPKETNRASGCLPLFFRNSDRHDEHRRGPIGHLR